MISRASCCSAAAVLARTPVPVADYTHRIIVDANSAREAEALIMKHLPPGTVISKHAYHKRRRRGGQPDQEETPHDDAHVTYELATGTQALDAGAAPARTEGEAGGRPEELVL